MREKEREFEKVEGKNDSIVLPKDNSPSGEGWLYTSSLGATIWLHLN